MLQSFPHGIHAIDAGYVRPQLAAVHLIVDQGRAAIVDTAHAGAAARVFKALDRLGLAPADVDYLLLTHIHLDHAGGAGALMRELPNARLVVHPRGARHMADPARLWAGTVGVYGEELARALYGELLPVEAARIVEAGDGDLLRLGGRDIEVLETPGHARHHVCYFDRHARACFTGDTFGLSYRELDVDGRPSIFPTTTPVQFEPEALRDSIRRIQALAPEALYLTHFSRVTAVERLAADLLRLVDAHVRIAESAEGVGEPRRQAIERGLTELLLGEAKRQGWRLLTADLLELMRTDIELNSQGLAHWLNARG